VTKSGNLAPMSYRRVLLPSIFLATTSISWNVSATDNGHVPLRSHDTAHGVSSHGDEGVRFVCPRHLLPAIKVGMAEYLKSLAIPEALVVVTERPADGVLVYTLATPPRDTSTLDFSALPAMNISTEEVTLSVGPDSTSQVRTVSRQEILLALLQHGRLTTLRGSACSVEALSDHVALRQNIVAWAENLRWGWPNGEAAEWNEKYWNHGTPKPGVPLREAIDDAFANQSAYAMGCYTATKLAIVKGVLDYYDRVRASPALARLVQARLLSDHDPLSDLEPGSVWNTYPPHTHERRMEVYLYFGMSEATRVFHLHGQPQASVAFFEIDDIGAYLSRRKTGTGFTVKRELEEGWFQTIDLPTPAVLTIQSGGNRLRYATLMGIKKAKTKEVRVVTAAELAADSSPVVVLERVTLPTKQKSTQILPGTAKEAAAALIEKLKFEARVL